uniref:Uncharacterized protein n=1 Tax=Chromera velia CCMP2878 TaxID=1169474 RepID=A0A0G4F483_9ALVE|eukprot:Cvel_15122.t1-p1 / transcript=Cvel_15122.t1 / gene=Cvel_15122 / organism=Chromera_velia_CCMP2878 / gene_product=hypothetical protein / transcript_product=hypothetical protein / location=Cvel_scaffold1103:49919-54710(+) / protein_length=132 / sequence_SO=supercontig / SO=protein_coding / is_pseudo=false
MSSSVGRISLKSSTTSLGFFWPIAHNQLSSTRTQELFPPTKSFGGVEAVFCKSSPFCSGGGTRFVHAISIGTSSTFIRLTVIPLFSLGPEGSERGRDVLFVHRKNAMMVEGARAISFVMCRGASLPLEPLTD